MTNMDHVKLCFVVIDYNHFSGLAKHLINFSHNLLKLFKLCDQCKTDKTNWSLCLML